jgi:hypothetical protein
VSMRILLPSELTHEYLIHVRQHDMRIPEISQVRRTTHKTRRAISLTPQLTARKSTTIDLSSHFEMAVSYRRSTAIAKHRQPQTRGIWSNNGLYELTNLPTQSQGEVKDSSVDGKRGSGHSGIFVARNKLAVLNKTSQVRRHTSTEVAWIDFDSAHRNTRPCD